MLTSSPGRWSSRGLPDCVGRLRGRAGRGGSTGPPAGLRGGVCNRRFQVWAPGGGGGDDDEVRGVEVGATWLAVLDAG